MPYPIRSSSRTIALTALVGLASLAGPGGQGAQAADMGTMDMGQGAAAGEHAHHHHHMVQQAVSRTSAAYQVPDVTLEDQQGHPVALQRLLQGNEPVMLNFIFTSCTAICPVMSGTFAQVQDRLGPDAEKVRMISISIDPEHDIPPVLAGYAQRFHAGPEWVFLTGQPDDVVAVQRAFDAYKGDKMNHTPLTLLRASPRADWVRYDGFASAADLTKELRAMVGS
jgi:protein SCO1/2